MADCRGHHPDDGTPGSAPCRAACTTRIHHALDRITNHLGDIHTHGNHGRTNTPSDQTGTRTTGTRTTPTPSPVWDLTDETLRWLTNWADTIADTQGHHGPRRARRDRRHTVPASTNRIPSSPMPALAAASCERSCSMLVRPNGPQPNLAARNP